MTGYSGQGVSSKDLGDGIWEIVFDHQGSSVNKFDKTTLNDLDQIVTQLEKCSDLKGVLATSAKPAFIVGADVTEFPAHFKLSDAELTGWLEKTHSILNRFEDLQAPTVAAIGGLCLGGGCEFALSATFRILSSGAQIGLPEVKLGLYPGWGGTVRLPRLIGADNAIEWMATGKSYGAEDAYKAGAADAVVEDAKLRDAALDLLAKARSGRVDWQAKRQQKLEPLQFISPLESVMAFETAKSFVGAQAGPHYPAPLAAVASVAAGATSGRDQAIKHEMSGFVKMAKTSTAESLVTIFLSDQFNKKKTKSLAKTGTPTKRAAVLGAGIMGGGIAYQSASKGTPALMKDIKPEALELGLSEAAKLFGKLVARKKIDATKMAKGMAAITPTLSFGDFGTVDLVVEAVVENEKVKDQVLCDLEGHVRDDAVIASNTSTISITQLAKNLKRPEKFCGLHFFNPVHRMPLVEVIRGQATSDDTVARAVSYALQIGKTPIVVNDCPGFLVNRILFPYFFGFSSLLTEGVDFTRIDKVMEKFGWPMGPAYLLDVIGIDTAFHAADVMNAGFPDRMPSQKGTVMDAMVSKGRYGQKTGSGFYKYAPDRKGKPKKVSDPEAEAIVASVVANKKEVTDDDIIQRMMIPLINESVRCLEEKIVETPIEVDLGLVYGVGFPPFRGGALKYLDHWGIEAFCKTADSLHADYGEAYKPAELARTHAKSGRKFYEM